MEVLLFDIKDLTKSSRDKLKKAFYNGVNVADLKLKKGKKAIKVETFLKK